MLDDPYFQDLLNVLEPARQQSADVVAQRQAAERHARQLAEELGERCRAIRGCEPGTFDPELGVWLEPSQMLIVLSRRCIALAQLLRKRDWLPRLDRLPAAPGAQFIRRFLLRCAESDATPQQAAAILSRFDGTDAFACEANQWLRYHLEEVLGPEHWPSATTENVAQVDPGEQRPPAPTVEYCAPREYMVRWQGEREVRRALWHLFVFLMQHAHPEAAAVTFTALRREVYRKRDDEKKDRSIRNDSCQLNDALARLQFPWEIKTANAGTTRHPRLTARFYRM